MKESDIHDGSEFGLQICERRENITMRAGWKDFDCIIFFRVVFGGTIEDESLLFEALTEDHSSFI